MSIIQQQWNQLNDKQKKSFQDEIEKKFKNGNYPSENDVLHFLNNKGQDTAVDSLGDLQKPPGFIDRWERVLNYFNDNK